MKKDLERDKKCGSRLKSALAECGVLAKDMARDLNYSTTYFSQLCNGKASIDEEKAKKFADYLSKKHGSKVTAWYSSSKESNGIESDYYSFRYFMGETEFPNAWLSYCAASKENEARSKDFSSALKYILADLGYTIPVSCEWIFDFLCTSAANDNPRGISLLPLSGSIVTLRKKATGKEIQLSLYQSVALLYALRNSAEAILDGLFLSRSAIMDGFFLSRDWQQQ